MKGIMNKYDELKYKKINRWKCKKKKRRENINLKGVNSCMMIHVLYCGVHTY